MKHYVYSEREVGVWIKYRIKIVLEKYRKNMKYLFVAFMNLEKTYDIVNREEL